MSGQGSLRSSSSRCANAPANAALGHDIHVSMGEMSDIDDQPQSESGERRFHVFHPRGVTQVEHAIDLRQVPA